MTIVPLCVPICDHCTKYVPSTYIWPVSAVWASTNSNDGDAGKGDLGNGQTNLIWVAQLEFCFDKIPPDLKSHFQKEPDSRVVALLEKTQSSMWTKIIEFLFYPFSNILWCSDGGFWFLRPARYLDVTSCPPIMTGANHTPGLLQRCCSVPPIIIPCHRLPMDKPPKTPQIGVKIKSGRGPPGVAALLRLRRIKLSGTSELPPCHHLHLLFCI